MPGSREIGFSNIESILLYCFVVFLRAYEQVCSAPYVSIDRTHSVLGHGRD